MTIAGGNSNANANAASKAPGGMVTDTRVELFLGKLLRFGVLLAALVVLTGGVWFLAQSRGPAQNYKIFRGEPSEMSHVQGIAHEAFSLQPLGLIQFGLLLLIATPVARVLFSVLGFALERDWMYVVITLGVLVLLIYTLTIGAGIK
jgi:uncharacterized membrane protein